MTKTDPTPTVASVEELELARLLRGIYWDSAPPPEDEAMRSWIAMAKRVLDDMRQRDAAIRQAALDERDAEWARAYCGDANADSESWYYRKVREGGPEFLRGLVETSREVDQENQAELLREARLEGARRERERCAALVDGFNYYAGKDRITSTPERQLEISGVWTRPIAAAIRALPPLPEGEMGGEG